MRVIKINILLYDIPLKPHIKVKYQEFYSRGRGSSKGVGANSVNISVVTFMCMHGI